ncbi:MAG: AAC(3) family N-acetyltransferase [Candidatus Neomarinimicrobiota bacterium]
MKPIPAFDDYLNRLGLNGGYHLLVHSSYRRIRSAFPSLRIDGIIASLQSKITTDGSIIMPAFSYCFKRRSGGYNIFDRERTPTKTGAVSEVFRTSVQVVRTSSPTHSFSLWGKITDEIDADYSPESPLGDGSVLEWLSNRSDAFVLLLGVDFSSMSFCHYMENRAPVPWSNFSPWNYLGIEPIGVSIQGEQPLREIPGCAKSFVNFESHLRETGRITNFRTENLTSLLVPVSLLMETGLPFFRDNYSRLLCDEHTCPTCDSRRVVFLSNH